MRVTHDGRAAREGQKITVRIPQKFPRHISQNASLFNREANAQPFIACARKAGKIGGVNVVVLPDEKVEQPLPELARRLLFFRPRDAPEFASQQLHDRVNVLLAERIIYDYRRFAYRRLPNGDVKLS